MPVKPIVKKSNLDQFYTKIEVAQLCMDYLYFYTNEDSIFLEPSVGAGSFYNLLPFRKVGYEIDTNCSLNGVWIKDFLSVESLLFPKKLLVIVGNPPFGSRNKLTNAFIKQSVKFSNIVAFILPNVYKKETMQRVFPADFSLVEDINLPKNSFLLDGKEYHVPCCFQIWIKNYPINLRESVKEKSYTEDFIFKKTGNYFIFGAAPSKIILREQVTSNNRGYYLTPKTEKVIDNLRNINWNNYALSSVNGNVSWFTKQMIIGIYNHNIK